MNETITPSITLKLFAGFKVTSELRMHLNHSSLWKENEILNKENSLKKVNFEDEEYLGLYLSVPFISLNEIAYLEDSLKQTLLEICPQYKQEKLILHLFSQPFIH